MSIDHVWGFDIETNQLGAFQGEPAILSAVLWQPNHPTEAAFLLDHPLDEETTDDDLDAAVEALQSILGDPTKTVVGHNLVLFDVVWWERLTGLRVEAKLFDTRVAQTLIDENVPNSLSDAGERYLGRRGLDEMKDMRKVLEEVDPAEVLRYNIDDSELSYQLYEPMKEELIRLKQWALFESYMEEYRTLADMTLVGTRVDGVWIEHNLRKLGREEAKLHDRMMDMTGGIDFNPDSPKQLAKVLYEDLRFPILKHTKTGQPSTSAQTLRELRLQMKGYPEGREFLDTLINLRRVKKLSGTYLGPYRDKHQGNDGRIHPTIYVGRSYDGGTRTGRLSMSNPNLQNVPRDMQVKGAFVPTEGWELFDADYAQVELRVVAFLAKELAMLKAFRNGLDIHTATLADVEGKKYKHVHAGVESGDEKWKKKRAEIKAVNFLILYGGGPYQLVTTLRDMGQVISMYRAKQLIELWYKRYWRIAQWIEENQRLIKKQRKAVNIFGQVRHLPLADGREGEFWQGKALRQGVNFLVQSVAAKFTLLALPPLNEALERVGGRLLLTVHDSIVGEYPPEVAPEIEELVKRALSVTAKDLATQKFGVNLDRLPLDADVKLGLERWG